MIDTVSNLIDAILNNIMALMPFIIVFDYERGVRWTLGKNPQELQPGFSWSFYFIHSTHKMSVVDDTIHLPGQTLETKDNKLIHLKTAFGYRISDVVKHYTTVDDFKESSMTIAMRHIARRIRKKTLGELRDGLDALEVSLEGTLTTQFKSWGTEVFAVGFTDFAEIGSGVRLFQDDNVYSHIPA